MHDPLHLDRLAEDRWTATVPPSMAQGRSAFGGLVAGLALRGAAALALRGAGALVPADRPARSILTDFVAPIAPGPVEVVARHLRSGRALSQVEVRIVQDDQVALVALCAFGAGRPTALGAPLPVAPDAPSPEALVPLPYLEGVTPTFTQHFAYRWARGGFPFSGTDGNGFGGYIRPRHEQPVDAAWVLCLLDGWPCPVLQRANRVVPASSVTWLVNFVRPVPPAAPDAWWRFETDAVASAEGYVDADARLFAPDGGLVATSRQLMAEYSA